jgi:hypothetical protein
MANETKVLKCGRVGKFRLSLLEIRSVSQQPEFMRDYSPERIRVQYRVAIQHGRKVRGEWINQTIWCSPEEFVDLANCIDVFNGFKEEGDDKSPESSAISGGDEK